ncbi:MAG: ABC-F family ATP-binding cassette domain-containing protein [Flavobacteriales bacterium]|nr:ABC-F family ATP-binding cassette domain-containing protein [Flavobacteriales bacterium]
MISFSNFSFEFGGRYLYKDADWHIKPRERIGLVGKNGTGKSTLLRLITGDYQLREGEMSKLKNLSIGFLNQDLLSYESNEPIVQVAMQAFERELFLETEINKLLKIVETDYSEENLHKLGEMQEEFLHMGGYDIRYKTEEILEGLGFSTSDLSRALSEFSGGWRMRVMLAKLLLMQPQLLMLDEPTNHLDLPSIEWLENYLTDYEGTVIIVSHDRYFLNRMVTKIVEIANQKIYQYTGNYDSFLSQKKERDELQARQYENQQQYIKEQEKFITRFKAKASKATSVQSRIKMLDKLDLVQAVEQDNSRINIRFNMKKEPGKVIFELKNLSKSYGPIEILQKSDALFSRGDRVALIGANGKGKSTLLRIIAGTEKYEGERNIGYNVIQSFYAQHQLESLNLENEVLQELTSFATDKTEVELRTLLGGFLFQGDDVFKKIKVLSGGEKARVSLAKMITTGANFLVLDEPTNHLDMQSIEILIEVLNSFEGSFIVVSHDRHFVSKIANKIWWIEEHQIKEYPGTYGEFDAWNKVRLKKISQEKLKQEVQETSHTLTVNQKKENKGGTVSASKMRKQLEDLEAEIESNKSKTDDAEAKLSLENVYNDPAELKNYSQLITDLKRERAQLERMYEECFEQLMALEEQSD